MLEEMADSGVSLTTEDTHGARMRALLAGGLEAAEFDAFLTVTGAYEEMNATLETPIPEATRAHEYKKLVCNISDKIATAMLLNISMIEAKALSRGKNPARDDPIGLVTQAAMTVLGDEQNVTEVATYNSGRAFYSNGQRFDPIRDKQNNNSGGQTWQKNRPTENNGIVWREGMRDCDFCKDRNIPPQAKQHTDANCTFASKEQIDALLKARAEQRKAKQAQYGAKKKGKNGSARLAQSSIDDDEAASERLFGEDKSILLDLGNLISTKSGSAHMVRATPSQASQAPTSLNASAPATSLNPSVPSTAPSAAPSAAPSLVASESPDPKAIFVVKASGDDAVDEISVGIFVGDWKNEVLPHAQTLFNGEQLPFSRSSLKSRAVRVPDLNAAVLKCDTHNINPIFLGPIPIDGLTLGDDVAEHLNLTENEDECASCTSSTPSMEQDSGSGSEPDED